MTRGNGDGPEHADAANGTRVAEFLIEHFQRHQYATVESDDFKAAYGSISWASAQVDWDAWLTKPGMPPVDIGQYYDGGSRRLPRARA